jgi:hypothetical protein
MGAYIQTRFCTKREQMHERRLSRHEMRQTFCCDVPCSLTFKCRPSRDLSSA